MGYGPNVLVHLVLEEWSAEFSAAPVGLAAENQARGQRAHRAHGSPAVGHPAGALR